MAETSAPWDGTATGDATSAPYDAPTEWARYWRSVGGGGRVTTDLGGVFFDELNELAVSGTSSPVSVATGRALAYGTWYQSDAAVSVAVATPAASTRIDRIVLRKSWAAQTVRVTRIAGVEGGSAPALVQVAGTTWDTPLAQVSITTGGVITVTDERSFVGFPAMFVKRKTATETVNNSTTLQNDDTFSFPVKAGQVWQVQLIMNVDIKSASDFKCTWTLPAASSCMMFGWMGLPSTNYLCGIGTTPGTAVTFASANDFSMMIFEATLVIAADGTAQFQWAQNTAVAENTSILINSAMIATKISG